MARAEMTFLNRQEEDLIHGQSIRTLEEIGKLFGLTRERIRQIEARALRKLRGLIAPEAIEGFA